MGEREREREREVEISGAVFFRVRSLDSSSKGSQVEYVGRPKERGRVAIKVNCPVKVEKDRRGFLTRIQERLHLTRQTDPHEGSKHNVRKRKVNFS